MDDNPYDSPTARLDDAPVSDADARRQPGLEREFALRTAGLPCLWLSVQMVQLGLSMPAGRDPDRIIAALVFAIGAAAALAGCGFLRLRPWVLGVMLPVGVAGIAASFFTALPLAGYIAWLAWSRPGRRILSAEHAAVRAQAPHLHAWHKPLEGGLVLALFALHFSLWRTLQA